MVPSSLPKIRHACYAGDDNVHILTGSSIFRIKTFDNVGRVRQVLHCKRDQTENHCFKSSFTTSRHVLDVFYYCILSQEQLT